MPDGYMSVEDMMSFRLLSCMNVNQEDMENVMRKSSIDEDDGKIRFMGRYDTTGRLAAVMCCQGHNDRAMSYIDPEKLLVRVSRDDPELPEFLYHGTFTYLVESIWREGLIPGGHKAPGSRTHIHFVTRLDGVAEVSGVRTDSDVVVVVKAWKMMEDGLIAYWSRNRVFLTEGFEELVNNVRMNVVPPRYLARVYERTTGRDLTPHDVLPLPETTRDGVPVDGTAIMEVHLTAEQAKTIQGRIAWTSLETREDAEACAETPSSSSAGPSQPSGSGELADVRTVTSLRASSRLPGLEGDQYVHSDDEEQRAVNAALALSLHEAEERKMIEVGEISDASELGPDNPPDDPHRIWACMGKER